MHINAYIHTYMLLMNKFFLNVHLHLFIRFELSLAVLKDCNFCMIICGLFGKNFLPIVSVLSTETVFNNIGISRKYN